MTKSFLCTIAAASVAACALAFAPVAAHAKTVKECEADYKAAKADLQKTGQKKTDFMTKCRAEDAAAKTDTKAKADTKTSAAPAAPAPAAKPSTTTSKSAAEPEGKPGRQAMIARERACGADWKADKAAGKTGDQKWPQYWSECNKRKKSEGM